MSIPVSRIHLSSDNWLICLSHTSYMRIADVIESSARERCVVDVVYELRAGTSTGYITFDLHYIKLRIVMEQN